MGAASPLPYLPWPRIVIVVLPTLGDSGLDGADWASGRIVCKWDFGRTRRRLGDEKMFFWHVTAGGCGVEGGDWDDDIVSAAMCGEVGR